MKAQIVSGCVNMEVESGGDNIIEHKCRPEVEMPEPCEVNGTHDAQTRGGGGEKNRGEGEGGAPQHLPSACFHGKVGKVQKGVEALPSVLCRFCSVLPLLYCSVLQVLHGICTVMYYYRPMQFKGGGGEGGMRERDKRQRDT